VSVATGATLLAAALAVLAGALFLWSYGLYPIWIARRAGNAAVPEANPDAPPGDIEVVLAAADEEAVIGARVRDLLAQAGVARVSIGCDGSRDATAARAREAAAYQAGDAGRTTSPPSAHVRVVEFPKRRGKAAVLNDLIRESTAELLVFTDANTRFDPGAVASLASACAGARVGAACGRLVFERAAGARATPERDFWDRETRLKEAEGRLGVCLGANGAIYAVRRELATPLPVDTTSMDDFLSPVRVARAGWRVVFAGEAVAREDAARDVAAEASRRFRIGIGEGQVLRREPWLWDAAAHPTLTLASLSRKAARWLAPLLGILAACAALAAPPPVRGWGVAALGLLAALLAALALRPSLRGWGGRLYYFAVLNAVLALGVAAGLLGYSRPVWTRTARS
jgi:cellulose synthase/poly-beta-1,6-N-acetylglucosamine synthase-like glycosyltransferase